MVRKHWVLAAALLAVGIALSVSCRKVEEESQPPAPATMPAEPAEPPPAAPEPEPAPPAAADQAVEESLREALEGPKEPTGWADAKLGSSVTYRMPNDVTMTMTVVQATADEVTLRIDTVAQGFELPSAEQTMPRYVPVGSAAGTETPSTKVQQSEQTLTVAGKPLKVKVYTTTITLDDQAITTRAYMSDEVPGGTVKTESDATGQMVVQQEVVEYHW